MKRNRRMLCPVTGKVVFFTQREAQRIMNYKLKAEKLILMEYKCKHCAYFHLAKRK